MTWMNARNQRAFGAEVCDPRLDLVKFHDDGATHFNKVAGGLAQALMPDALWPARLPVSC